MYVDRENGSPQGDVISPLLSNIFLQVVFEKWMEKNHPEKRFERYQVAETKVQRDAPFIPTLAIGTSIMYPYICHLKQEESAAAEKL